MKTVIQTNGSLLPSILIKASKQLSAVRIPIGKVLTPLPASQETFLLLFFAYFLTSHKERAVELVKEIRPDLEFVVDSISDKCFDHWFFDIVETYAKDYEKIFAKLKTLSQKEKEDLEDELRAREAILLVDLQKLTKKSYKNSMRRKSEESVCQSERP